MAATPISHLVLQLDRRAVDAAAPTLAGMDRGCSLTKFVYVARDGEGGTASHYGLHCVIFPNAEFEAALRFLKARARLPATGCFRVTGVGCDRLRAAIEAALGLRVEVVNEFLTMFRGVHFLLSHAADRDTAVFFPPLAPDHAVTMQQSSYIAPALDKLRQSLSANNGPDPDALFPCLFLLLGSGLGAVLIHADGSAAVAGGSMIGGKVLLALGRAMADADGYDELLALAQAGSAGRVDTTVGDYLREDPQSPYAHFPPDLPLFSFGQLVDSGRPLADFEREDRAAGVVRLVAQVVAAVLGGAAMGVGVSRVVVGGHGVRGEAMRTALADACNFNLSGLLELRFLRTGVTGALGAMISDPADVVKFVRE